MNKLTGPKDQRITFHLNMCYNGVTHASVLVCKKFYEYRRLSERKFTFSKIDAKKQVTFTFVKKIGNKHIYNREVV